MSCIVKTENAYSRNSEYVTGAWMCPASIRQMKLRRASGAGITYLAGLYRFEEHRGIQIPVFAVLTRESVAPVSIIHNRMPVILGKEHLREWIRPDGDPDSIAAKALTKMIVEKAKDYPEPVPAFMQTVLA